MAPAPQGEAGMVGLREALAKCCDDSTVPTARDPPRNYVESFRTRIFCTEPS